MKAFYDVGMRTLSGFERADVAQHFGLCEGEPVSALTSKKLQRASRLTTGDLDHSLVRCRLGPLA